jgi:hypothetical protein
MSDRKEIEALLTKLADSASSGEPSKELLEQAAAIANEIDAEVDALDEKSRVRWHALRPLVMGRLAGDAGRLAKTWPRANAVVPDTLAKTWPRANAVVDADKLAKTWPRANAVVPDKDKPKK